jgi:hypothetical protein
MAAKTWSSEWWKCGGGDNLFLASIVALNADTGEYVWHYQTTPGETWDFTATRHIMLADLEIDGMLAPLGMVSFKDFLDAADAKAIRRYVLSEANRLYAESRIAAGAAGTP